MHYKIALFLAVVASVVLHELGHAASALAFGDDTAKQAGRITLNPWKVNPFGAVILPALLVLAGSFPIAFASTPVSPRKMRNPRWDSLLCSLAGPGVNIVLVGLSIVVLITQRGAIATQFGRYSGATLLEHWPPLALGAYAVGYVNVLLAVFNLVPIPPLDGSAVIERLLPRQWWPGWIKFRQYGMGILVLLILGAPQIFRSLFNPFLDWWLRAWIR